MDGNKLDKAFFLEHLRQQGLQLTSQRRAVVNEIFCGPGHFEAEELLARLHAKGLEISRATVYRTLGMLQACSLMEKRDFGEQGRLYETTAPGLHHDHLICTGCGKVIEFDNPELEKMQQRICERFDFMQTSHTHYVFGLCQDCLKDASNSGKLSSRDKMAHITDKD